MLKLICDHCEFEVELIHTLTPKKEDTDGSDGQGYRMYWEICNEQSGIGYASEDKYFDREPNELDKINWHDGLGITDKNSIRGHFCAKCKKEYRQYLDDYKNHKISLESLLKDEDLSNVNTLTTRASELRRQLDDDYYNYKQAFIKNTRRGLR